MAQTKIEKIKKLIKEANIFDLFSSSFGSPITYDIDEDEFYEIPNNETLTDEELQEVIIRACRKKHLSFSQFMYGESKEIISINKYDRIAISKNGSYITVLNNNQETSFYFLPTAKNLIALYFLGHNLNEILDTIEVVDEI